MRPLTPLHSHAGHAPGGYLAGVRAVSLGVLGRLSVRVDGQEQPVRGRRERAVLCVLIARRGEVGSWDRLVEEVWGDSAPPSARGSLQVAVSRLRLLLEPGRRPSSTPDLLVTSGTGYALCVPEDSVDAGRFTRLVERAHQCLSEGQPQLALDLTTQALATWTGEPFQDAADGELIRNERARLRELRLGITELRAEALLALDRPALCIGDLESLLSQDPFREGAWSLLATALYRAGRQADALGAVRRARRVLVEELGVDPSPELQALERALLTQDPALRPAATPRPAPSPAPPDTQVGSVPKAWSASVDTLIGRDDGIRVLEAAVAALHDGRGGTMLVTGEAGIGKTRLASAGAELAERSGVRVLWGRCHEADVSPAYWPWVPIVRGITGLKPVPELDALLSPEAVAASDDGRSAALRTYDAVARALGHASTG